MRKATSARLGIYADVREVADLALAHGGGEYECEDTGTAQNFAHRFYRFRQLFREVHHSDGSPCDHDRLILPRVASPTVIFRIREHQGTFRPASRVTVATEFDDDELFNIAAQIAAKVKGDEK